MTIEKPSCLFNSRLTISIPFIFILLLYLAFGVDCINTLVYKSVGENGPISKISRGILEVFLVYALVKNKEFRPLLIMTFFSLLNFFGLLLVFVLKDGVVSSFSEIVSNAIIVNKFFLFFLLLYFLALYIGEMRFVTYLYRFFEFSFAVYIFSIFVGYFFEIEVFESYIGKSRFGYKGFIVTQNEAVGLFLIGMFYFYTKFKQKGSIVSLFVVYLVYIAGFLVGSKACIGFLTVAFVCFHLYLFKNRKFLLLLFVLIPLIALFDWQSFLLRISTTVDYVMYFYDKGDSILSIVLTGRNWRVEHLIQEVFFTNHYTWYNYVFGGFNFLDLGTEMDVFDVLTLFGMCGFLYYIIYLRLIFAFSAFSKYMYGFMFLFLSASTLGGHLIYNAVIPIYLLIMCVRMREYSLGASRS